MRASSLPARTAWAASGPRRRSTASESAARCPAAAAARCAPRCAVHRAPRTACRASLRAATAGARARAARSGGWKACGEIGKSNGDIGMRRRRLPPLDFSHPPLLIVTMTLHRLALLPALVAVAFASQAAPDAKLLAAGQAAQPAVIDTLKEMVTIESGSANAEGLAKMADYTEKRLHALGAKTERIKATRGPGTLVKGSFAGSGRARILLIAHMDTVYPANTLATQPIKLDGNKLYGPGIADDKGGVAVILHSLKILGDAGWRDYARLTVLFNPDE